MDLWHPETPSSSSNTIWTWSRAATGSSILVRAPETRAAGSLLPGLPNKLSSRRKAGPPPTSRGRSDRGLSRRAVRRSNALHEIGHADRPNGTRAAPLSFPSRGPSRIQDPHRKLAMAILETLKKNGRKSDRPRQAIPRSARRLGSVAEGEHLRIQGRRRYSEQCPVALGLLPRSSCTPGRSGPRGNHGRSFQTERLGGFLARWDL